MADISLKILFDESIKRALDNLLINDPNAFIEMIRLPNSPLFFSNISVIDENENDDEDDDSLDGTRDISLNQGNLNFNNFAFSNIPNNNNNNHSRRHRNNNNYNSNCSNYSNYNIDRTRIRNEERMKKYCMAQAYVYEKCLESHLFIDVIWDNKISENEEGKLVILGNSHRYNVRK